MSQTISRPRQPGKHSHVEEHSYGRPERSGARVTRHLKECQREARGTSIV
jgi:hypothetical protein